MMKDRTICLAFAVGGATLGLTTSLVLAAPSNSRVAPQPSSGAEPIAPPGVRAKLIGENAGARTYQLVLAPGTEAMGAIEAFVTANHIASAHFEGLGACTDAVLAYWDPAIRDYRRTPYRQQMEIISIVGDAAPTPSDGAGLHAHMGVAFADGTMHGGHLFETHVSPTMELVLSASTTPLRRRYEDAFHGWLLAP
jgi:uncharacterized protein